MYALGFYPGNSQPFFSVFIDSKIPELKEFFNIDIYNKKCTFDLIEMSSFHLKGSCSVKTTLRKFFDGNFKIKYSQLLKIIHFW